MLTPHRRFRLMRHIAERLRSLPSIVDHKISKFGSYKQTVLPSTPTIVNNAEPSSLLARRAPLAQEMPSQKSYASARTARHSQKESHRAHRAAEGKSKLRLSLLGLGGSMLASLIYQVAFQNKCHASSIDGVHFVDQVRVNCGGAQLQLHGTAVCWYQYFFRAYASALYLENPHHSKNVLDDIPKRLELSYFWGISANDFANAANQVLAKGESESALKQISSEVDMIHAHYCDVKPGDRYALTYTPGLGTELSFNGNALCTVPGRDFAKAYFGIWLGKNPIDEGFRDKLLQRTEPTQIRREANVY